MGQYDESEEVAGSSLEAEFDATFTGDERADMLMKLTSDKFTRRKETIKISQIGFSEPIKRGRKKTMTGLTASVKDIGVVVPIHVMLTEESELEDSEEDDEDSGDYKYMLVDGVRRVFAAMKNGISEIDAIVWDFKDKEQGMDLALVLSLVLNRTQNREWSEVWDLYQILEMQTAITPGTLEYLLQLNGGDAMKLKDVMLCDYDEPKQALLNNEKDLEACYKLLQKLRKEEDQLAKDDATGFSDTVEGAEEVVSDNVETDDGGQLSDQDVLELLEMADDLDNVDEVTDEDFDEMNKMDESYIDAQKVGERHPLDPAIRQAVLQKDDFTCQCCGMKLIGARLGLIAVHHVIPVHCKGKDSLDNLVTLCLNCHINLHIMERNGGSIMMSKEDFDSLTEPEQLSLKKARKLAQVAIEADKRRGLSKKDVQDLTRDAIRHPMPGTGLKENQIAYSVAKNQVEEHSVPQDQEEVSETEEESLEE